MSSGLFGDDVVFAQRLLRSAGLYAAKIDGIWGSKTDTAMTQFEQVFKQTAVDRGTFDPGTEARIHTLHPAAQKLARRSLKVIRNAGINARIISGTRSYAEQDKLFRQGRFGNKGPVVTNARGGQSNHNFGVAWDIGIFDKAGRYLGTSPEYAHAGSIVMAASIPDLEWGGNWPIFKDRPHYQVATGLKISDVRARFEAGKPIIQQKEEQRNG